MVWTIPVCDGCNRHDPCMIMLHNDLWNSICPKPNTAKGRPRQNTGVLCFQCIESRLGRKVTFDDLKLDSNQTNDLLLGAYIAQQSEGMIFYKDTIGFNVR